jgi:homoserine kinase
MGVPCFNTARNTLIFVAVPSSRSDVLGPGYDVNAMATQGFIIKQVANKRNSVRWRVFQGGGRRPVAERRVDLIFSATPSGCSQFRKRARLRCWNLFR